MAGSEKTKAEFQRPSAAIAELQANWVNDTVRHLKRITATETEISKEIANLVNAGLEAAIVSQKEVTQMTGDAMATNDPVAMMTLPHRFLYAIVRQGLESSVRNLQSAQSMFARINEVTVNDGDKERPKP